jgi:hypothetical protein
MKKVYCLTQSYDHPHCVINGILLDVFESYEDAVIERNKLSSQSTDKGVIYTIETWHVEPKSKENKNVSNT